MYRCWSGQILFPIVYRKNLVPYFSVFFKNVKYHGMKSLIFIFYLNKTLQKSNFESLVSPNEFW